MDQQSLNKLANPSPANIIAGFDGFIDNIIKVVKKRSSPYEYESYTTIEEFSRAVGAAMGKSANFELVTLRTKMGGNGPLMANTLAGYENNVHYIGSLGYPELEDVFKDFANKCKSVYSLTPAATTDALEFEDGKLLMGKMEMLKDVNRENLLKRIPRKELEQLLENAQMLIFNNWTMLTEMNGIIDLFFELMVNVNEKPAVFIDLADPAKRENDDICEVIRILGEVAGETKVILSMNQRESEILAEVLGLEKMDLHDRAMELKKETGFYAIVIHPLEGAIACSDKENSPVWVDGPYTEKPFITTGAGDNFNAGFAHGWLNGLPLENALRSGVFTSGFYVRNGYAPDADRLVDFITKYKGQ